MTRILSIIILFGWCFSASAQKLSHKVHYDTLNLSKNQDGSKSYWLIADDDTILISRHPNGKIESRREFKNGNVNGKYERFDESGRVIWSKTMVNNVPHGSVVYYNKQNPAAHFRYTDGVITDTVFINWGLHLVLGKVTYSSTVYGGAVNEDGTSNISHHSGVFTNCKMYAAKVDSVKKPELVQHVKTDMYGEFFMFAPEGNISFFPDSFPIKDVQPGQYYAPSVAWSSGTDGWDPAVPLLVNEKTSVLFVNLHYASVGYAP